MCGMFFCRNHLSAKVYWNLEQWLERIIVHSVIGVQLKRFNKLFNWTLVVAGRALLNRVCPSFHPSVLPSFHPSCLSGRFLGIASLVFSKFWNGARNLYEVVFDRVGFSRTNFFTSKMGKIDQKWAKNRVFLTLLKKLVINCSITKIYIICCVPAQTYLGKFLILRYGPKCSQPIRLQDQPYLQNKSVK